jgi:hypothetical protein
MKIDKLKLAEKASARLQSAKMYNKASSDDKDDIAKKKLAKPAAKY